MQQQYLISLKNNLNSHPTSGAGLLLTVATMLILPHLLWQICSLSFTNCHKILSSYFIGHAQQDCSCDACPYCMCICESGMYGCVCLCVHLVYPSELPRHVPDLVRGTSRRSYVCDVFPPIAWVWCHSGWGVGVGANTGRVWGWMGQLSEMRWALCQGDITTRVRTECIHCLYNGEQVLTRF